MSTDIFVEGMSFIYCFIFSIFRLIVNLFPFYNRLFHSVPIRSFIKKKTVKYKARRKAAAVV